MANTETLPALREDDHGVIPHDQPSDMLGMIARAAVDPSVSVEKLERLMALKERYDAKAAETAFAEAMARLQPTLPRITKHGRIMVSGQVRNTYAKLEDIDEEIRPLYSAEGFSISWNTSTESTVPGTRVLGKLRHRAGHSEAYAIFLPNDNSGGKNGIQGVGSTVSYGKRYLLCSMFNIITVDADDDGSGTEVITIEQKNRILDLITERNADYARFCRFMDVQEVEEITQDRFEMAINALQNKGRR